MPTEKHITGTTDVSDLAAELQAKKLQLHWLLQISKAINYNFTTKQLLDVYEHVLHSQLKVERLALLIHEHHWKCALLYGTDKGFHNFDLEKILEELNVVHDLETEKELWIKSFDTIIPVFHKDQVLAYALIGGMKDSVIPKKNELIPFIQTITNLIVVAIENNTVSAEKIRQAGIKKELELAAQMQNMLFPVSLPVNDKYKLHATYLPHQEVGGDYYDYIELNEQECMICIGDISGKGIAAALLMANFQASVRSYSEQQPSVSALIESLNSRVNEITKGEKYITFFLAKFNFVTRQFQYVNAGHNPAVLYHEGNMRLLDEGCTILGMFEKLPYVHVQSFTLSSEFVLFCYTDGLTDIENDNKKSIELDEILQFIEKNKSLSPEQLNRGIVDYLVDFKGNKLINDDVSMLTCKFY